MAEPDGPLPEPVSVISDDGRRYRCRACKAPIRRGDRCAACSRGWFVELVDATYEQISDGAVAFTVEVRSGLLVDIGEDGRVIGVERIGDEVRSRDLEDVIRVLAYRKDEPGGQP